MIVKKLHGIYATMINHLRNMNDKCINKDVEFKKLRTHYLSKKIKPSLFFPADSVLK